MGKKNKKGSGSGTTTTLNLLSLSVPNDERIIIIEDVPESTHLSDEINIEEKPNHEEKE